MVIVAAGSALEWGPCLAAIRGTVESHVGKVNNIRIRGIDRNAAEVPTALADSRIGAHALPACAAIVRTEQAAVFLLVDERVNAVNPFAFAGCQANAAPL